MGDTTESTDQLEELSKAIALTIEEHLAKFKGAANWPQTHSKHTVLRVDAFLEEQEPDQDQEKENIPPKPFRVASVRKNQVPTLL